MLVQMNVRGLMFDPHRDVYVLILRNDEDEGVLPVWIEKADAYALGLAIEGIFTQRPLTHDLFKNLLDALEAKIISIVISDLKESIYYSKIHLVYRDSEFAVDARPSDAIAMALRAAAPIFVAEHVIKKQSAEGFDRWLDHLKPEDFGKYSA